jgi:hypothetical protein
MNTDDELIAEKLTERRIWRGLVRSAVIWTPPFVVCAGLLLFFFFDMIVGEERGTWFLVVVLLILSALFGAQSLQAILDLISRPATAEGEVTRRWARNDSLVIRTHYMRLGKTILRGEKDVLADIATGDRVVARYHPHTGVLISVKKLAAAPKPTTESQEPAPEISLQPREPKRRGKGGTVERPKF